MSALTNDRLSPATTALRFNNDELKILDRILHLYSEMMYLSEEEEDLRQKIRFNLDRMKAKS